MPRVCAVCTHTKRSEIDQSLVNGEPYRVIAQRCGISHDAVFRHKTNHLPPSMARAKEAAEETNAEKLLCRVMALLADAQHITARAKKSSQLDTALRGINAIRGILQLLGQLSGELKSSMSTTVNIVLALKTLGPDEIQQMLLDAGHGGWIRLESLNPEENERRIYELLAKAGMRPEEVIEFRSWANQAPRR